MSGVENIAVVELIFIIYFSLYSASCKVSDQWCLQIDVATFTLCDV